MIQVFPSPRPSIHLGDSNSVATPPLVAIAHTYVRAYLTVVVVVAGCSGTAGAGDILSPVRRRPRVHCRTGPAQEEGNDACTQRKHHRNICLCAAES